MSNSINASTEEVFEYTGKGCVVPKDVTIIRFHPSVVEVEKRAFQDCKQLREVVFNDGLRKIGWQAFRSCQSLSSIALPSTVTEIDECAFMNCKQLREIVLNEGQQNIGDGSFYNCTSLSSITLPSTVMEVGSSAFKNCNNLREVLFNNGLRKIEWSAFENCTSLPSIVLPSTLTEIGKYAFCDCNNLREVVFHGVPLEIEVGAFTNSTSLVRFTFPTISTRLDNLIHTGHWEEIENEVHEIRGVVERSDGHLFVSAQAMEVGRNWNRVRESLDNIVRVISRYELKEGTSIFELALWKLKLDQVDKANPNAHEKSQDVPGSVKDTICSILGSLLCCSKVYRQVDETNSAVRDLCRIDVPGPVKDTILEYLR